MIETKDIFTLAGPTSSGRPFLNENQMGALSISGTFLADRKTLMNWIKRTPEAIGILRQIAMDVVTRINFTAIEEQPKKGRPIKNAGKDNEFKARKFSKDNFLKQQLRAAVTEGIALGDAYFWKGKASQDVLKELIRKNYKEFGIKLQETEIETKALDESYTGQTSLQYIASSTVDIKLDEAGTKIEYYTQRIAAGYGSDTFPTGDSSPQGTITSKSPRKWKPEQIIHYRFMDMDGKVHGFTPLQSSFPIIKTLGAIKDYHGNYFESAIVPDIIFNFEENDPNTIHHQRMAQMLQEWWDNKRRGPAITTGKFDVKEFNKWNKDMEFRLLAIYYTGVIAFSVGMPLEKIRAILGGEIKSATGASDISNTDYQRNIYDMQDDWEILLNTQFFNEEFGVNLKFERSAARDEVAEAMRDGQKLNFVSQMFQKDLIKKENQVDVLEQEFPAIPRNYWNPNPEPEIQMGGMMPSSKVLPKGQGQEAYSEEKKKQQEPQQKNKPPMGV